MFINNMKVYLILNCFVHKNGIKFINRIIVYNRI